MTKIRLEFAERLRTVCAEKGLKQHGQQAALAKIFKISQPAAKKWLDGEALPQTEKSIEIAAWADVHFEWLVTGKGPKNIGDQYTSRPIKNAVEIMEAMSADQQNMAIRLLAQIIEPEVDPLPSNSEKVA